MHEKYHPKIIENELVLVIITLMVLVKFLCVRLALYFEIFSLRSSAL